MPKRERDGKISVDIRGETLKQALALRHKREDDEGVVVGVSEVVRDAIKTVYNSEIKNEVPQKPTRVHTI